MDIQQMVNKQSTGVNGFVFAFPMSYLRVVKRMKRATSPRRNKKFNPLKVLAYD